MTSFFAVACFAEQSRCDQSRMGPGQLWKAGLGVRSIDAQCTELTWVPSGSIIIQGKQSDYAQEKSHFGYYSAFTLRNVSEV